MELLKAILTITDPTLTLIFSALLSVILFISVAGAIRDTDENTAFELILIFVRRALLTAIVGGLPVFIFGVYCLALYHLEGAANEYMMLWLNELLKASESMWWSIILVIFAPLLVRIFWLRWLKPEISAFWRRYNVRQSGDALSDIRVEVKRLKQRNFDPRKFYKNDFFFLGLDDKGKPVYVTDEIFRKNHIKILGPSQTGKGVGLGVLLDQAIRKGMGAWFIDQKPDDFIYDIMRETCEEIGREPPEVVDLNGVGPGKYAPFIHGTMRERRERVVKAFKLSDIGGPADFYKRKERQVLDYLMPFWDGTLKGLEKLLKGNHPSIDQPKAMWIRENASDIISNVSEFTQLDSLCADHGDSFNVENALLDGRVVYIKGHMKDTIVRKGTIALLDEVVQVALRKPLPKPIFLVIDEVRFLVTDTLADALATVLSKGINMALAYQSIMDLQNLPDKTLNAASIKVGIETNTQITISHRANESETAEWVALQTGITQRTVAKVEKVTTNAAGADEWDGEKSFGTEPEALIHSNRLISLPPRIGILIRPNELATTIYTSWIPVKELKGIPVRNETATREASTRPVVVAEAPPPSAPVNEQTSGDQNSTMEANEPALDDLADKPPEVSLVGDDPFAEQELTGDDPFAEEVSATPTVKALEAEDRAPSKKNKAALSTEEAAAIAAAAQGILKTEKKQTDKLVRKPPINPEQDMPAKVASADIDLSSLDDIQGL